MILAGLPGIRNPRFCWGRFIFFIASREIVVMLMYRRIVVDACDVGYGEPSSLRA